MRQTRLKVARVNRQTATAVVNTSNVPTPERLTDLRASLTLGGENG